MVKTIEQRIKEYREVLDYHIELGNYQFAKHVIKLKATLLGLNEKTEMAKLNKRIKQKERVNKPKEVHTPFINKTNKQEEE